MKSADSPCKRAVTKAARASVEHKGRKVVVAIRLTANGELCAEGTVIAVQIPESMLAR